MLPSLVSLDHFRSRVYRQRIALVLLVVLLGLAPFDPEESAQQPRNGQISKTAPSSSQPTLHNGGRSTVPDAAGQTISSPSSPWLASRWWWPKVLLPQYPINLGEEPTSGQAHPETQRATSSETSSTPAQTQMIGGGLLALLIEEKQPTGSNQQQQSDDGLLSSWQALSPRTLLLPTVFPTLVQLHALWLVRFISGEVEGRGQQRSGRTSKAPLTLFLLASLAFLVTSLLPTTATMLRSVSGRWTNTEPTTATRFPSTAVLIVEAVPVIASLAHIVLSLLPNTLPSNVKLPSPSHAPPMHELVPSWIRAPFVPSERARARRAAIAGTRTRRRHGGLTPVGAIDMDADASLAAAFAADGSDHQHGSSTDISNASQEVDTAAPTATTAMPLPLAERGSRAAESARLLRLQQDMLDELTNAGRLGHAESDEPGSRSSEGGTADETTTPKTTGPPVGSTGARPVPKPVEAKSLRRRKQYVSLPTPYAASLALTLASHLSTIASYAFVTLRLPNLAPTSLSSVVALIALRAEIGGLAKTWKAERRKLEGLEFVRRRWGVHSTMSLSDAAADQATSSSTSQGEAISKSSCAICFEPIVWSRSSSTEAAQGAGAGGLESDAVRLDCKHELHAPCLVPWLMTQAFCPVCHRPLRPTTRSGSSRSAGSRGRSIRDGPRRSRSEHRGAAAEGGVDVDAAEAAAAVSPAGEVSSGS